MKYLPHLDVATAAFLTDLEVADTAADCASIRWTTFELGSHLGGVHRWAVLNAREPKRHHRDNVPSIDVPVAEWYRESRGMLLDTLHVLDPGDPAYTLSRADRTVGFWHRRQLHETLVHLWDLRSASDPAAPPAAEVPAAVHADGVSELFDVFLPLAGLLAPIGGIVALEATDTGDRWVFGNDWQRDDPSEPTATVSGPAGDLLLYVWNRATNVERFGDLAALARFEKAHIRP